VAQAIVAALRRPRFAVYVPHEVAVLEFAHSVVPRCVFERLLRATKMANLMADVDQARRAASELRALTDGKWLPSEKTA
jgi:hypothetical protein